MVCVYCTADTKVVNSRHQRRLNSIWRRRVCIACRAVFTTREEPELKTSFSVSDHASNKLEPFLSEKLFLSIYDCFRHRPTALSDAAELTKTVVASLPFPSEKPISAADITQATYSVLHRFDPLAATLYKAYHSRWATS